MKYTKKQQDTLGQIIKQTKNCSVIKYNSSLGQNTKPQKKLDTTCKHNGSYEITHDTIKLHNKQQKGPRKTIKETCGRLRPEEVNKDPKSMIAT